jgi:putative transcriptional regulator
LSSHRPAAHPSRELLSAYASGWIAWSAGLCVRVHLDACSECRDAVATLEAAEEPFIDQLPEAPLPEDAVSALLVKLQSTPVETREPKAVGDVQLPGAMAHVRVASRRWIAPGFWVAHLPEGRQEGWRTYILRAPPGARLPMHGHGGPELVCVLSGAFRDRRRYGPGDFVEMPGGSDHSLVIDSQGPCACLIASKGAIQWKGAAKLLKSALSV